MNQILIRKIPKHFHLLIKGSASEEALSVNQYFIRLVNKTIADEAARKEKEQEREDLFRKIEQLRREIYEKYGTFDDSAKLIREDRDRR